MNFWGAQNRKDNKKDNLRTAFEFWLLVPLTLACMLTDRALPVAATASLFFLLWRIGRNLFLPRAISDFSSWIMRILAQFFHGLSEAFRWSRLAPFVGLLLFMLGLSLLITVSPETTLTQVQRVVLGLGACLAIRDWLRAPQTWNKKRGYALGLVALGGALAAVSPVVVEWQGSKMASIIPPALYRIFPLLVSDGANPNVMAGALLILFPLAVSLSLRWPAPQGKIATHWDTLLPITTGLCATLIFAMLVLTQSRGAWLATAISMWLLANLRWRWLRPVSVLLVLLAGLMVLLRPVWLTPVFESLSTTGSISGSAERQEIWTHAWYMIQDFSFTGVGMGNFRRVNDLFYPLYIATPDAPHAHNLFLQVAVDLGIPGFLAWLGLFVHAFYVTVRAFAHPQGDWVRAIAAGLLVAQVAMSVHGLLDCVVWGVMRTALIVWLLWGLAYALEPFRSNSLGALAT